MAVNLAFLLQACRQRHLQPDDVAATAALTGAPCFFFARIAMLGLSATCSSLVERDHRNRERIFPYVGGEEVNDDPEHKHHRYVINFEDFPLRREQRSPSWAEADDDCREDYLQSGIVPLDYTEPVAADWPDLLKIIDERVKPERLKDKSEVRRRFWWKFGERTPALFASISHLRSVLAVVLYSSNLCIARLPTGMVYTNKLNEFAFNSPAHFCILQCRIHELWARFLSSTLKDDLAYAPSDCFETFPFPANPESNRTWSQPVATITNSARHSWCGTTRV